MMRLKELRRNQGISQAQFARDVGVAQNTVSNWENGNRVLDAAMALRVADYFGVSVDYLLGRDRTGPADVRPDDFTYALYGESRELTEENKKKLLEMARFFKLQQEKERAWEDGQ